MDKQTVTIEQSSGVTNVVITKEIPCEPVIEKKTIPYDTLVNHIAKIDVSIAQLEAEKLVYQDLIEKADIEIAKKI